jgi:hypothetical protein
MMIMEKKDFFIYNPEQTRFFIEHGLIPIFIGTGKKGDSYHRFKRDDEAELVFTLWCNRNK